MAKELSKVVKLQVRGGAANPSPPVGPALGAAGVNIMEFCCLLYTSPSPRDKRQSRMPSSA